jgi:hypothetical protein
MAPIQPQSCNVVLGVCDAARLPAMVPAILQISKRAKITSEIG